MIVVTFVSGPMFDRLDTAADPTYYAEWIDTEHARHGVVQHSEVEDQAALTEVIQAAIENNEMKGVA